MTKETNQPEPAQSKEQPEPTTSAEEQTANIYQAVLDEVDEEVVLDKQGRHWVSVADAQELFRRIEETPTTEDARRYLRAGYFREWLKVKPTQPTPGDSSEKAS